MNATIRFAATFVGLGLILSTTAAFGAPLTFTIDGTQSSLSLSLETSPGVPFTTAQFPGSDTTSLSGTQVVDVTGSSVQFVSTGNIQFAVQPLPVAPAAGGAYPGSDPGQYGLLALIPGFLDGPGPGGTGLIAARGLVGDSTSGAIPLAGNAFDASQVVLAFTAGVADINSLVLGSSMVGTVVVAGGSTDNELTGGTLTSAGGIDTLTLPIHAEAPVYIGNTLVLEAYSGQIVATAVVPEPSTWMLAALGGFAMLACRLRGGVRSRG